MESLGYVECNGLSGAIVAADRMLKTADVKLSSIQNTKGNGWVTLQVSGELSAVSVAVQAVKEGLPNVYVTSTVIGRPATGVDTLGKTDLLKPAAEKKASKSTATAKPAPAEENADKEVSEKAAKPTVETASAAPVEDKQPTAEVSEQPSEESASTAPADTPKVTSSEEQKTTAADEKVTCNLCGDPKCPRKLGESHKKCIHYNELKKK